MFARSIEHLISDPLLADKMLILAGPRQVGKTTTAKKWLTEKGQQPLYYNWDNQNIRRLFRQNPHFFESAARALSSKKKPRIVLDEIHKLPQFKTILKGFVDSFPEFHFFVTGSAKLELFQRAGDSLLGRYHLLHLLPLTPLEASHKTAKISPNSIQKKDFSTQPLSQDVITALMNYSGFPDPFKKQSQRALTLWQREYAQRLIREDLRDLTRISDISRIEHLFEILPTKIGSPLSLNSLREDLLCSYDAVRSLINAFKKLYLILIVRPYAKKIQYAVRKEPKIYFYDWTRLKGEGQRFENFMAIQLSTYCQFLTDGGWGEFDLYYVRDKQKREVDFLITKDHNPSFIVEAKLTDDSSQSLEYFQNLLGGIPAFLVVQEPGVFRKIKPQQWHLSANRFFQGLWG